MILITLKLSEINTQNLMIYYSRKKDSLTIWLAFLLLGWSYGSLGKIGLQILFYLTLGGLGIWTLVRLFTLNGAIKDYNRTVAIEVGLTAEDILKLGL
jgi:hypothetical protein